MDPGEIWSAAAPLPGSTLLWGNEPPQSPLETIPTQAGILGADGRSSVRPPNAARPKIPRQGWISLPIRAPCPPVPGDADWLAKRIELELRVFPLGGIGSESEPPNWATETNAARCPRSARSSPSPVPVWLCPSPKTPRKRGSFRDGRGERVQRLRDRRLVGGESGIRTHGARKGTRALQARTFDRSVISPRSSEPGAFGGPAEIDSLAEREARGDPSLARDPC